MNRTRLLVAGSCLLLFVTAGLAAEEKTGLSALNPFSKSTSTKSTTSRKTASHKRTSEPSTWDKVTSNTQAAWTKTKQTLMPWTRNSSTNKHPATQKTGNKAAASQKKSPWTGWLTGEKEEPQRPQTVNEFLAQPRPK